MTRYQPILPSGRSALALDLALGLWTVAWIVLAIWVASEVRGLRDLSDTVVRVGNAVETTGEAIEGFERVPIVGDDLTKPADRIKEAGASARSSGRQSRESVETLSTLLGISIGVIPSVPVLLLYVPWRIACARERRAVRAALAGGPDAGLEEFLARRAAEHLPYPDLRRITPRPWRDLDEGRHAELAAAELRRMGLDPGSIRDGGRGRAAHARSRS